MHGVVCVISELVRHQIIAQVVGADSQRMLSVEGIIIECMHIVLYITVITHVIFIKRLIITLIILVESVTDFKVTHYIEGVVSFHSTAESPVSVLGVPRFIAFTEIIAGSSRQFERFQRTID